MKRTGYRPSLTHVVAMVVAALLIAAALLLGLRRSAAAEADIDYSIQRTTKVQVSMDEANPNAGLIYMLLVYAQSKRPQGSQVVKPEHRP